MLSHLVVSDSFQPHGPPGFSVHGENAGVGCHALLQGIFPTQGSNPGLPHCRQIVYHLSHQGSPRILEWAAYPFSRGSSQPRNQTGVFCTAGGFFTNWAISATQCTVAHRTPLSMGFSSQEYWSGLPFPSPGDLPNPGIEPRSPALQADALTSEPPGKPVTMQREVNCTVRTQLSHFTSLHFKTIILFCHIPIILKCFIIYLKIRKFYWT